MVLFSLINVWFNKGGFEYTFVCRYCYYYVLLPINYYMWIFVLVRSGCMGMVWAWYGMGMVKQDGRVDGWDGMG